MSAARGVRAAQHAAARALSRYGIGHPAARALLTVAAGAAAAAYAAGHHVRDIHPTESRGHRRT
ncbi:hypothetical protein LHJ74_06030 [Streptomyces sp. N2-109]|uniref:Uncharacterized protein n=1 Tax=Streptomyces gossypii TaxID=2883101 RepID=A0ABT2JP38_9ACTN|nr:hypothetical protein [Streptomyces gossypii]MCT2589488.1 hypothetical protein [Streptomyces gossypii]